MGVVRAVAVGLVAFFPVFNHETGAGQTAAAAAAIRGRVTVVLTGEPVRGATVQATAGGTEKGITLRATTDDQGRFEIGEIPPGQYRVTASRNGFVARQLGQRSAFESVDPITVRPGQVLNADFTLTRGGAISGRVFDDNTEPVAEVRIQAMRVQTIEGRRRLVPVGNPRLTDDLGVYRVYGLPPGEYLIAATIGAETLTVSAAGSTTLFVNGVIAGSARAGSTSAYAATYFPGTPRVGDAHRINLTLGEEEDNVNFALAPARLVRVSGTVTNQSGEPIQARLELVPEIEGLRTNAHGTVSGPDGTFSISGVPPGVYNMNVIGRIVEDKLPEVAWLPVDVWVEDVSDLTIVTTNGSTVAGRVSAEGTSRPNTDGMRIVAHPVGVAAGRNSAGALVSSGYFQLSGLVGPYALTFEGLPRGFAVRSITANGADITDGQLEFRGTEYLDVQALVTNRLAELYGTVRAQGKAVPRASVVVFPEDPSKWTGASRSIRTARTGQYGDFAIRELLPNQRYLVAAVEYLNDGEDQDSEFLLRMKPRATILPASTEQNRTMDLTLITR